MHVEIGIRVLNITHVWTLLLNTELVSSTSMRSLCPHTILTLETPHGEVVVLGLTQARVVVALLAVCTHEKRWRFC